MDIKRKLYSDYRSIYLRSYILHCIINLLRIIADWTVSELHGLVLLLHGHFVHLHELVVVYYILASIIFVSFIIAALVLWLTDCGVVANHASYWLDQLHFVVVGGQPEVNASRAAQQVGEVLVFASDQALEHLRDVTLHRHLLKADL